MTPLTASGTHSGRTMTSMNIAPLLIMVVAHHLAPRLTTPPRRHSRMGGPIRGWFSSQWDRRGELLVAAQAASRMNGTVGMIGRKMPITPRIRLTTATPLSSQRTGRDSWGSSEAAGGGGGTGITGILPCRYARRMTVREILKIGDARLLRVARPVTDFDSDEIHRLVTDLFDTMRAANGAGLAAPQIGVDRQLVIFGTDAPNPRYPDAPLVPRTVLLNPVVTPLGDEEEEGWEGCLSVPGLRGLVPRFKRIRYTGFDQYGDAIEREAEGFHARVVQHECDHLVGKLYPMRMRDFTQFGFTEVLFPEMDAGQDD